jgi:folate-binding protein YgfZ
MGWRAYVAGDGGYDGTDFDRIRVRHCIPEAGIELIPNETFILEAGFERLHGVDFRKGCYVGQEVTARMKHKTELRKGFATVEVDGAAPVGTPVETADGKAAGTLYTQSGGRGIAYLRFDRAAQDLRAGAAIVHLAAGAEPS